MEFLCITFQLYMKYYGIILHQNIKARQPVTLQNFPWRPINFSLPQQRSICFYNFPTVNFDLTRTKLPFQKKSTNLWSGFILNHHSSRALEKSAVNHSNASQVFTTLLPSSKFLDTIQMEIHNFFITTYFLEQFYVHRKIKWKIQRFPMQSPALTYVEPLPLLTSPTKVVYLL